MCGGRAVEVVGVDYGDEESSVGEVFCVRTCLPLPLSMVESPLVGIGGCIDVSSCSNDTCMAWPLYTILTPCFTQNWHFNGFSEILYNL